MTTYKLEIRTEDQTIQKWCVPLKEDVFASFMVKGSPSVHKVFGDGSLFSPFLFGKFFDPADGFPLWEFESDVLLSKVKSSGRSTVDWFQTDTDYVLRAELPELTGKNCIQVCVDNGKFVEIVGLWRPQKESNTRDWRSGHWWEHGYVRRLELPENADWMRMDAHVTNEILLDIRIPKNPLVCDTPHENDGVTKDPNPSQ